MPQGKRLYRTVSDRESEVCVSNLTHSAVKLTARFQNAMRVLADSFEYAEQTSGDRWEFAVEIKELLRLGLTKNDLRWLVRLGYIEHAREVTRSSENGRSFRPTGDLTFRKTTCFVLTSIGATATRENRFAELGNGAPSKRVSQVRPTDESLPEWDPELRELRFGEWIVKRFKWHAINQERILAAFQEEGWPHRIDDPLVPQAERDSKRRLSDTIKCLNRKQQCKLIRFRGDGTGEGVIWDEFERNGSAQTEE